MLKLLVKKTSFKLCYYKKISKHSIFLIVKGRPQELHHELKEGTATSYNSIQSVISVLSVQIVFRKHCFPIECAPHCGGKDFNDKTN